MKKTLILIALALLIMVPVFAKPLTAEDNGTGNQTVLTDGGVSTKSSEEPKDTTVKIELKQYPKYMTAITTTPYSSDGNKISHYNESSATKYDKVPHVTDIEMEVNTDTWTLKDKDGYYVTYYAYENNQNVEYSIKLNGNMKLTPDTSTETEGSDSPSSQNQKEIRYIMEIIGINGEGDESSSNTVTLYSDGEVNSLTYSTIIRKIGKTVLIGKSTYNSYAMAVKAYTKDRTTDTVQYNIVGNYEGTVTLTIKSSS